jgi:hypothetical protein
VRKDGAPSGVREALALGRVELALYLATGAAYVALGVAFPELLFAWVVAVGFLLVSVVVLPAVWNRAKGGR